MEILDKNKNLLAIILKSDEIKPGRNFLTNNDQEMQLAAFDFQEETIIENHIHNKIQRSISSTSEVLTVIEGEMLVKIFDNELEIVHSENLFKGDTVALFEGGYGLEIKKGCKFIESKQGPYYPDKDKKKF